MFEPWRHVPVLSSFSGGGSLPVFPCDTSTRTCRPVDYGALKCATVRPGGVCTLHFYRVCQGSVCSSYCQRLGGGAPTRPRREAELAPPGGSRAFPWAWAGAGAQGAVPPPLTGLSCAPTQDSCARVLLFRGGNKELKNYNSQTPFQVGRRGGAKHRV